MAQLDYGPHKADRLASLGEGPDVQFGEQESAALRLAAATGRTAIATWLSAAFLIVYFLFMLFSRGLDGAFTLDALFGLFNSEVLLRFGAWTKPLIDAGEVGRFVPSAWIFYGYIHLVFGIWILLGFGKFAEAVYGGRALVFILVTSGIAGNLTMYLLSPVGTISGYPVATPFGPIFGLWGAVAVFALRYRWLLDKKAVRRIIFGGVFFIVLWSVVGMLGENPRMPWALIGGSMAGALSGLLFRPMCLNPRGLLPEFSRNAAFIVALLLSAGSLFMLMPDPTSVPPWSRHGRPDVPPEEARKAEEERAEVLKMVSYTDPDNRFSIDYPAEANFSIREGTIQIEMTNTLIVSLMCNRCSPNYGRRETLELMLQSISLQSSKNPPSLIEKWDQYVVGENEFAAAKYIVPSGPGFPEQQVFLLVTDSGKRWFRFRVVTIPGDYYCEKLSERILASFMPVGSGK